MPSKLLPMAPNDSSAFSGSSATEVAREEDRGRVAPESNPFNANTGPDDRDL